MSYLTTIKHPNLKGKRLVVHKDIKNKINELLHLAMYYDLDIYITSSFRKTLDELHGAIVTPAKMSNHYVGYAFDCNIIDESGKWWNSKELRQPKGIVKKFIDDVKELGFRWGGDFSKPDPVHFDIPLNHDNPDLYEKYFYELQNTGLL
jgi:hypothetical protein